MKIAYLDCAAGISGDMCLGALVDAGASLNAIRRTLKRIPLSGYKLTSRRVTRSGVAGTKVDVIVQKSKIHGHHPASRRWPDIVKLISSSSLDDSLKQKGLEIFRTLFESEGRVHGESFNVVHLHELGAKDCIVDIFGTIIGLNLLGIEKVFSSPVNLGQGTVQTAHGSLPVPAPATIDILRGLPVYASQIPWELTTPTGAVLLKSISSPSLSMPCMTIASIGYGAGNKDISGLPNMLRIMIGEDQPHDSLTSSYDTVIIMETNIDDMSPQYYESVMSRILEAGALDVFLENIIMKKGRPAIKLTSIVRERDADKCADIIFRETTTIGIRLHSTERKILEREIKKVRTRYGIVRFKISRHKGDIVTATPEYDDLMAISARTAIPVKELAAELAGYPKCRQI
jgi:pyridinium-3,5-bisthiocarboxylic acid mononucleotide nickel chelatase